MSWESGPLEASGNTLDRRRPDSRNRAMSANCRSADSGDAATPSAAQALTDFGTRPARRRRRNSSSSRLRFSPMPDHTTSLNVRKCGSEQMHGNEDRGVSCHCCAAGMKGGFRATPRSSRMTDFWAHFCPTAFASSSQSALGPFAALAGSKRSTRETCLPHSPGKRPFDKNALSDGRTSNGTFCQYLQIGRRETGWQQCA